MESTLVVFAHPALEKSRANQALLDGVRDLPGLTIHDLYEEYPHFDIDPAREQELLLAHDRIVWQHPFYWYSTPALMKEWFDVVLQYGWAYGNDANQLKGKSVLTVTTTGGGADAYQADGYNRYPMAEFLRPLERTAELCGMSYEEPLVFHGALHLEGSALVKAVSSYRNRLLEK